MKFTRCVSFLFLFLSVLALSDAKDIEDAEFSEGEQPKGSATILAYHHVSKSTPPSTSVTPVQFREHMEYLKDNHTVIALDKLIALIQTGGTIPDKSVAITFDDGFTNILANGHGILREFGFPYTIFVNTDKVGSHTKQLSWEQLKKMSEEGALIANHYLDHRHLLQNSRDPDWLETTKAHILQAEAEIKANIGSSPGFIAYPFGEYNLALSKLVKDMGVVGFAQHSGGVGAYSDLGLITRFPAAGIYANLKTLKVKLASLNMPVLSASITDPAFYEAPEVKFTLDLRTQDFRPGQLNCFFRGEPATLNWAENSVEISSDKTLKSGRSRVNCTAPSISKPGRFYWYSQPFFVATPDGRWLD